MRILLLLALVIIGVVGCPETSKPPTPTPQPNITEELLRREKERRMEVEQSRDKEIESRERWKALAAFVAIGGVLLLIAGIIVGSRTRRDAERG
jgi:hypothetical protein